MASTPSHHALVVGASGLIGWAVVDQLLQPYPSLSPFGKVTALVNRPLELEDSFWPVEEPGRPELSLVSGVTLLYEDDDFEGLSREKVVDVETGHGIYRRDGIFAAMADKLPDDYLKLVSCPHYRAMRTAESIPFFELVPDAIIGFTPHGSGFSLASHWAGYLCAYALVCGAGAEIPFPGMRERYDAKSTETSSATLARVGIYAAPNREMFARRLVNVADSEEPSTTRVRWPQICKCFGLQGVEPREDSGIVKPSEFIKNNKSALADEGAKGVDIWNQGQLNNYGYWLTFDRQLVVIQ